jgi:NADH-quinone oxidoreductase subunit C
MASKLETLKANLEAAFGGRLQSITEALGQLTVVVKADKFIEVALKLRDDRSLGFEQLVDLCGMDYSAYGDGAYEGPRFASVLHLLSISNNWRVRVRVFAPDDDVPIVPSAVDVWSSANWYEREAFVSSATRSARTSRCRVMSRCAMTRKRNASYISQ